MYIPLSSLFPRALDFKNYSIDRLNSHQNTILEQGICTKMTRAYLSQHKTALLSRTDSTAAID